MIPDEELRIDNIVDCQNIFANRAQEITTMFDDIAFAFNANAIEF